METADFFHEKAEQCSRLANAVVNSNDPVVANLLALAVEFESKAVALTAEQATEKQVEQTTAEPDVRHGETAADDNPS